ncbi:MAG: hypothetical protein D6762_05890 [Candidatus Neomarinimicrobiota bacterium]|nr:MAG: hypothetical protein D6762_05890 [Candidatus Neomarinimicrobiota bacterium]
MVRDLSTLTTDFSQQARPIMTQQALLLSFPLAGSSAARQEAGVGLRVSGSRFADIPEGHRRQYGAGLTGIFLISDNLSAQGELSVGKDRQQLVMNQLVGLNLSAGSRLSVTGTLAAQTGGRQYRLRTSLFQIALQDLGGRPWQLAVGKMEGKVTFHTTILTQAPASLHLQKNYLSVGYALVRDSNEVFPSVSFGSRFILVSLEVRKLFP